jgi:hypothetical protein
VRSTLAGEGVGDQLFGWDVEDDGEIANDA